MYKDKDKQRKAGKERQRRYRERRDEKAKVTPILTAQGNIRVSKPGDTDYEPQCETTRAFVEDRPKRPEPAKRGKDIKCFQDLPPDVQATIDRISETREEKDRRTTIAIGYQHLYPGRYYATGLIC